MVRLQTLGEHLHDWRLASLLIVVAVGAPFSILIRRFRRAASRRQRSRWLPNDYPDTNYSYTNRRDRG